MNGSSSGQRYINAHAPQIYFLKKIGLIEHKNGSVFHMGERTQFPRQKAEERGPHTVNLTGS